MSCPAYNSSSRLGLNCKKEAPGHLHCKQHLLLLPGSLEVLHRSPKTLADCGRVSCAFAHRMCSLCFRVKRSLPTITRSGSISMTTCGQAVFCTQDVPSGHTDYSVNIVRPLDHVLLLPRVILCFLCFLNVLRQKVLIDTFISLFLYEKYQGYRVFLNRSSPVSVAK